MEVGCTVVCILISPHTVAGLLTPVGLGSGIIYQLLLRSEVDVASFDRRMLSVSWGSQFSAFLYIILSLCTHCDQVVENLIYARGFHLVWFNVLAKEMFGFYFTAQARR